MSILVKKAVGSEEINDVLTLRYNTLISEGKTPHPVYQKTKMISDPHDVYSSTKHIIAYDNGRPCATVRLLEVNNNFTFNSQYDFSQAFKNTDGKIFFLDLICFHELKFKPQMLFKEILSFCTLYLHGCEANHLFLISPKSFYEYQKIEGLSSVGDEFFDKNENEKKREAFIPCGVDINQYYEFWSKSIKDQEILRFQESFYKSIFFPGEILILQGERGGSAYLIEEGELEVLIDASESQDGIKNIGKISKGSLVGEMAMVTGEKRTASVMATVPTFCLAFDRTPFMKILEESPQRVIDIFRLFSKRITSANQRLVSKAN